MERCFEEGCGAAAAVRCDGCRQFYCPAHLSTMETSRGRVRRQCDPCYFGTTRAVGETLPQPSAWRLAALAVFPVLLWLGMVLSPASSPPYEGRATARAIDALERYFRGEQLLFLAFTALVWGYVIYAVWSRRQAGGRKQ